MRTGARSGERRWSLAGLRRAEVRRIERNGMDRSWMLLLRFEGGERLAIGSRGYLPFGLPQDLSASFAVFCRELLARAARAAPGAVFLRGPPPITAALVWALVLLGAGAGATLISALLGGTAALGLDLGARLLFAFFLVASVLPWLTDERRRAFDPADAPSAMLPGG